ncbi:MAG TPA: OmpA family protein, partial [Spirochaetota bacterium]|nr:OmpA family protein [Spirochaetota bacterium]
HLIITTTLNKGEEIIKKHVSEAETTVAIPVLGDSKILCKGRSGFQGGQGFIDNESIITEYRKNAGYNHQINMYLARYVSLKFSAHDAESKKPVPAQFIISSYINNKLVSEDHIEKTAPHNSIMVPVAGTSYLIAKAADHFPGMLKITADRKDEHKTNIIHVKKLTAAQENIVLIPNINFISNNTSLTRPAQLFMETLGELLQKAGLQKLELRGYCNKSENEEYNNQIALQKADTVKAVLQTIMKNAVIETDGFGSKLPETSRDQDPAAVIGIKTTTK